jgi:hypothetical protein
MPITGYPRLPIMASVDALPNGTTIETRASVSNIGARHFGRPFFDVRLAFCEFNFQLFRWAWNQHRVQRFKGSSTGNYVVHERSYFRRGRAYGSNSKPRLKRGPQLWNPISRESVHGARRAALLESGIAQCRGHRSGGFCKCRVRASVSFLSLVYSVWKTNRDSLTEDSPPLHAWWIEFHCLVSSHRFEKRHHCERVASPCGHWRFASPVRAVVGRSKLVSQLQGIGLGRHDGLTHRVPLTG